MSSVDRALLQSRLVRACERGDIAGVQAALALDADVNAAGSPALGLPVLPLRAAVCSRNVELVQLLLSAESPTRRASANGDGVMWQAAFNGTPDILRLLIGAGGSVNKKSNGELPVFVAIRACRGDLGVVQELLRAHPAVDLAVTNASGQTPEQYAISLGKAELAALIGKVRVVLAGLVELQHACRSAACYLLAT